ncbi:MAG: hypothetical protein JW854_02890 [Actinobacteria bacterium]|nr:hypothetical protein [Actinomycetota bacterium]
MRVWEESRHGKITAFFTRRERMDLDWRLKDKKIFSRDDWRIFNAALQRTLAKSP